MPLLRGKQRDFFDLYFEDAEEDEMPEMLQKVTWDEIKLKIRTAALQVFK